ncbi:MAG: glycosyltransferase family 2 protein [Actinomycetota bacterium]
MTEDSKDQATLTVIMPVYNEAATLRQALDRLLKTELPVSLQVVVVDDGSTDGSLASISDLIDGRDVVVVENPRNLGKGAAFRNGLGHATGKYVTILDADMEYDPADYVEVLRPLLDGEADVVYGTRTFGSHTAYSFWYVLGNRFLSLWASFLFNTWLSDIETCFKVAPTDTWRAIGVRSDGFGLEAEVTGKFLRRHRIYEVPISYRARGREEGKKLNWTDGVIALWILLRVRLFGK